MGLAKPAQAFFFSFIYALPRFSLKAFFISSLNFVIFVFYFVHVVSVLFIDVLTHFHFFPSPTSSPLGTFFPKFTNVKSQHIYLA